MRIFTTTSLALLAALGAGTPALAGDPGGAAPPTPAHVSGVHCVLRCADLDAARPGSTVRITGTHLAATSAVDFTGSAGTADDRTATPTKVAANAVEVRVPSAAHTGPLVLADAAATDSNPSPALAIDTGPVRTAAPGSTPAVDVQIVSRKAFFDGRRPASVRYLAQGSAPVSVSVALVRATDQTVVAQWAPRTVEPGSTQTVRWNGMDASTGHAAKRGRYEFRVFTAESSASARAAEADGAPAAAGSFLFYDYEFPIRGAHSFGTAEGRFGAARNGHIHQGQDTFAKCGTPLVAARGGVVKFAGFQGNAGNYIVIDAQGTGVDQVYMHLRAPALFAKGQKVRTGDHIGDVGDTGDAVGCHLHFEEWSAPGWYTGGSPYDPLPDLKAWDAFS